MVVVGILVAISAPSYQKAIEQSRTNIAAANLRAIWAAQRLYWLENHSYTPAIAPPSSAPALITMGLVDPALPTASNKVTYQNGGYYYEITNASDATFTAKATRASDGTLISVDQDGNWSVPDNVTLSFQ
jgi:Tfp pilus assembly protein PilE